VSRSPAVFDEQKLAWMNGHYIRRMETGALAGVASEWLAREGAPGAGDARLPAAVAAVQEKISTLAEIPDLVGFAFQDQVEPDPKAWEKVMGKNGAPQALAQAREALATVEPFDEAGVEQALRALAERLEMKPGALFQPVRVAITGRTVSAGIFESLALLGREESLRRVDAALARFSGTA
jgi:glutamyl-tRNA synthetase